MDKIIEEFVRIMDSNKCEDIKVLDMKGVSYLADYFIIATIKNKPHADMIAQKLDKLSFDLTGNNYFRTEGKEQGDWLLVDTGDIIVHLFQPDTRAYYNLDGLWGDADNIDISSLLID